MSIPQPDHDAGPVARVENRVFHALRRLGASEKSILVAVSGGADSTALLCCLARLTPRLSLRLEVATLDHGLRPGSRQEAQRVVALAQGLGLVAHARELQLRPGPATEQRARVARYAGLEALRLERGLELVATGHTCSDQAETVLMRLARGSALGGAAAIHHQRGALIRPLLGVARPEVVGYLQALGQPWVEDPMNADSSYLRVRVRRQLLPLFEVTAGPKVAQHLARFAGYAAEDEALLEQLAAAALDRVRLDGRLDAVGVDGLERPIRRRVIARWLEGNQLPVDAELLEVILEAISQGRVATLPRDLLLVNRDGWLGAEPAPSRNFTKPTGVRGGDGL